MAYTSSGVRISILPDTTVGERPFLNSVILKPPLHRRGQFLMSTGGQFDVSPDMSHLHSLVASMSLKPYVTKSTQMSQER